MLIVGEFLYILFGFKERILLNLREETLCSVIVKNEISVDLTYFSAFVQCTIHEINIF